MALTVEQQSVVDARNPYLLVSASAGSGKTRVLVEKIIDMIKNDGIKPEEFLILSFTKASANDIKHKLAIKLLELNMLDEYSQLNKATIGTIHSFCQKIIKNEFSFLKISPSFKVLSNILSYKLRKQAFEATLEKCYSDDFISKYPQIIALNSNYYTYEIESMVHRLYNTAVSFPDFINWILQNAGLDSKYKVVNDNFLEMIKEKYMDSDTYRFLKTYKDIILSYMKLYLVSDISDEDKDVLNSIINSLEGDIFENIELNAFSRKRNEKLAELKLYRKYLLDFILDKMDVFYNKIENLDLLKSQIQAISIITIEFYKRFMEIKKENTCIDYNDMEHMAYKVLMNTEKRQDIANSFRAIFIDECQDNSDLQETLIHLLKTDNNYITMVGDVKQSIYRFRNAEPKNFIKKLKTYSVESDADKRKIILNKNFRSNPLVLDATNRVFSHIMTEDALELNYGKDEMLYPGKTDSNNNLISKGLKNKYRIIKYTSIDDSDLENIDDKSKRIEAEFIAKQISNIVGKPFPNKNRNIEYRDIAILSNKLSGFSDILNEFLNKYDIPSYIDKSNNKNIQTETQQIVSWLCVLDNVYDDLSLLSILRGPIFNLSDDQLALIRLESNDRDIWYSEALYTCADFIENIENTKDENYDSGLSTTAEVDWNSRNQGDSLLGFSEVRSAIDVSSLTEDTSPYTKEQYAIYKFCNYLRRLLSQERFLMRNMNIYDYIWRFVIRSGLFDYYNSQADGDKYINNIKQFCSSAEKYLKDPSNDLSTFLEDLKIESGSDENFSRAVVNSRDNLVKIMTIHSSKGLEFPIVFVAGLRNEVIKKSSGENVYLTLHKDCGIGLKYKSYDEELYTNSYPFEMIDSICRYEEVASNARLLYVAMTRAEEFLYLVDVKKVTKEKENKDPSELIDIKEKVSIAFPKNYAEWINISISKDVDYQKRSICETMDEFIDKEAISYDISSLNKHSDYYEWDIKELAFNEFESIKEVDNTITQEFLDDLEKKLEDVEPDGSYSDIIIDDYVPDETKIAFKIDTMPESISVSKIVSVILSEDKYRINLPLSDNKVFLPPKHQVIKENSELFADLDPLSDYFKDEEQTGADIGTKTHFVMQKLDLNKLRIVLGIDVNEQSLEEYMLSKRLNPFSATVSDEEILSLRDELTKNKDNLSNIENPKLKSILEEIETIINERTFKEEGVDSDFTMVNKYGILSFIISNIGIRMLRSSMVLRENRFTIDLKDWGGVLLNGTIDLCFIEDDKFVIVDFKTGNLRSNEVNEEYIYQLAFYKLAIEDILKIDVKECILYYLDKNIFERV